MKELTLVRNPMTKKCGKTSVFLVIYEDIKELTLERNPTSVKHVGKPSAFLVTYKGMKIHTL